MKHAGVSVDIFIWIGFIHRYSLIFIHLQVDNKQKNIQQKRKVFFHQDVFSEVRIFSNRNSSELRNASLGVTCEFVLLNPPGGLTEPSKEGRDFVTIDPKQGDPRAQAGWLM